MFDSVPLSVYILEKKSSPKPTVKKTDKTPVDPEGTQKPKRKAIKKPVEPQQEDGTIIARLDIHTDDDRKAKTTVIDRKGLAFLLDEHDEDFDELLTLITSTDLWCGYDTTYWMKLPDGNTIEIGRFSHLKHAVKVARCYVGITTLA
jgi:hypothetical protein